MCHRVLSDLLSFYLTDRSRKHQVSWRLCPFAPSNSESILDTRILMWPDKNTVVYLATGLGGAADIESGQMLFWRRTVTHIPVWFSLAAW